MVSGEGRVQKTGALWRKGAELVDIPEVVMEKSGAVIDWSCYSFMSLRNAIAHSGRGLGGFAVSVYCRW